MKFGANLPRQQVPEWANEYIDYKGLKKKIKSGAVQHKHGEEPDLAEFFFSLDRNLETVSGFYNKKYAEASRRLRLLQPRYGNETTFRQLGAREEVEDILQVVLELRNQLRNLQWYGEINRRGFVKILKKKDKQIPTSQAQQQYLKTRVDPLPFASNVDLRKDMSLVNIWLSRLGELKATGIDETSDAESTNSLSRSVSGNSPNLPREVLEEIDHAAKEDDVQRLNTALTKSQQYLSDESPMVHKLLVQVLQRAMSCLSRRSIRALLHRLTTLDEPEDINKRNCIHRLVISVARSKTQKAEHQALQLNPNRETSDIIIPAEAPSLEMPTLAMKHLQNEVPLTNSDAPTQLFQFLLDNLTVSQRGSLVARDTLGRLPLHYAAQYGFTIICNMIISHMRDWGQFDITNGLDSAIWQDSESNSPLHLSVREGQLETTKCLLDACRADSQRTSSHQSLARLVRSSALLRIAAKRNYSKIIAALVDAGADVNAQDKDGETALHITARFGNLEGAKELMAKSAWQIIDLNVPEATYGWTPLHVASVEGHPAMAELLAESGANIEQKDTSGWTAKEHAALRGQLQICEMLAARAPQPLLPQTLTAALPNGESKPISERNVSTINREPSPSRPVEAIKSFGHRYLENESIILVSLGSMDQRKTSKPVTLDNVPLKEAHATQLDTALSIVVSATGVKPNEPTVIDLPVRENISTDPIAFSCQDITKVKLLFDIVPTYASTHKEIVGRGVALLSSVKPSIGSKRMNLQGDISVPIIASKTLDYIGTVNFNFLAITPFTHPNMSISENQTYWKSITSPMVIGHRGMGKNMAVRKSLQLGENTIQSFIAAANLGASYVEFDVQLTKDHVPVIYHDFLVSETGIDAPVHTLTLEQFLHVSEARTPRSSRPPSPTSTKSSDSSITDRPRMRERASSWGAKGTTPQGTMNDRMKHTRDYKIKGYKGNSRGNFIQAPFTTLEEMLCKLPKHIGFNIEMKYPMLFESEEQEMDTYAVELNSFVDTVLNMIYDRGTGRDFVFSSFNPDICLLLSFKQPSIPVLFLTDAGASPVGDIRASSLQEAIRFASRWNLLGVVSAAEPLVTCPRLVKVVKESGLVCVSYGTLNNEPENVKRQVDEGIDAVIVDSVLAIRRGLTHPSEASAEKRDDEATNGLRGNDMAAADNTVNGLKT